MNHFTLRRHAAWTALFALGLLAVLAGCSKKVTSVDAGRTTLDGRLDPNVRLLAWADAPAVDSVVADLGSIGPDTDPDVKEDTAFANVPHYRTGAGVIYTVLLDKTSASGYQFYRHAANGGLESLADYPIQASVKWLPTGWELYSLNDPRPSAYSPPTYVARGLLDGKVTTSSPLSNDAIVNAVVPRQSIRLNWKPVGDDTLLIFTPVPGAVGYWWDFYQFKSTAGLEEIRASGTPNPVMTGNVNHFHLEYGGPDACQMAFPLSGAGVRARLQGVTGSDVLTDEVMLRGQSYLVRVTAMDEHGNVLAWQYGSTMYHQMDGFYEYIQLGAKSIVVGRKS
jgi:hypothetical protein